ncbi:bifunctional NAD(P)H-hydrate repair enzyme Nnr [Geobacter sp. OR-1]|uniref:bifunctional ADP-dependent NAD(P)H-hydrate dehydratase/NAD(P)H-hydrate epimerase n=1 Tax=Geobacter sp. OR-1 TaxID=1266765 RepID=UPI000543CB9D|nr:bifunctional ADP-dependent NAD(P)H-hydrate dehydratase/NAD(P)H-hydrate epimerase [Geobacter sp. OR-1]GAM10670.1 bifunctional NAD(P)H-hydrate repair enzyme Nnr [Geobacter sp. OR-1]
MKIVTAEQMQLIDQETIKNYGIPGLHLMERAGSACAEVMISSVSPTAGVSAIIFAGKGNNGGDGYVIARKLFQAGWDVSVVVLAQQRDITGDAADNLAGLPEGVGLSFCSDMDSLVNSLAEIGKYALVVDAIFGTGLKSQVSGIYRHAIDAINAMGQQVIAVDIPSGIHGSTGEVLGAAVKADLTVTFASAKLGHVLYPGASFTGDLKVVDIGIPSEIIQKAKSYDFIDSEAAAALLRPRSPVAHKGSFGHGVIIAGSTGHTGAAVLAGNSAVRSGAGLVSLAIPSSLNQVIEIKTTEAMTIPVDDSGRGYLGDESLPDIHVGLDGKDVVAIGPGLSRKPETTLLVQKLIGSVPLPLVVDADGLNAISENIALLCHRTSPVVILTPHPGEMARLAGLSVPEIECDRIGVSVAFAVKYKVFLILKGARTVIVSPEGDVAINGSGNPGMASGGMGDVLTGIVTSLLCQGYPPFDACRLSVFIHGFSGDLLAREKGEMGITATDVSENLPYAFNKLKEHSPVKSGFKRYSN